MMEGLTDRQGAGIPNMYTMISMAAQHSYGYGTLNSGNAFTQKIKFCQPAYGASGYKKGDANMDGILTDADTKQILQMAAASGTNQASYKNIQQYLADFDNDGEVSAIDASLLGVYLSKEE